MSKMYDPDGMGIMESPMPAPDPLIAKLRTNAVTVRLCRRDVADALRELESAQLRDRRPLRETAGLDQAISTLRNALDLPAEPNPYAAVQYGAEHLGGEFCPDLGCLMEGEAVI